MSVSVPNNDFEPTEDFRSRYANIVRLNPSVWDLRLGFGEAEFKNGEATTGQHSAIRVPWMQVKLMAYMLEVQLALFEYECGTVNVAGSVIPVPPAVALAAAVGPEHQSLLAYLESRYRFYFPNAVPVVSGSMGGTLVS